MNHILFAQWLGLVLGLAVLAIMTKWGFTLIYRILRTLLGGRGY